MYVDVLCTTICTSNMARAALALAAASAALAFAFRFLKNGTKQQNLDSQSNHAQKSKSAQANSASRARKLPKRNKQRGRTQAPSNGEPAQLKPDAQQSNSTNNDQLPENPADVISDDRQMQIIKEDEVDQMHAEMDEEDTQNLDMIKMLTA